jgi:hypothetical protein
MQYYIAICAMSNYTILYCHLCHGRLYNIFPLFLTNDTIFEKKEVTEHKMCVLIFCTTLSETFLILSRTQRCINQTRTQLFI